MEHSRARESKPPPPPAPPPPPHDMQAALQSELARERQAHARLRRELAREHDVQALLRRDVARLELQLHELRGERAQDNVALEALIAEWEGTAGGAREPGTLEQQRRKMRGLRQELRELRRVRARQAAQLKADAAELRRLRGLDLERFEQAELATLRAELEEALERTRVMVLWREAEVVVGERISAFLCPITCSLMREPVLAADGHTYERSAITRWFANHAPGTPETSPKTALPVPNTTLVDNFTLKSAIDEAVQEELARAASAGARKRGRGLEGAAMGHEGAASIC